MPVEVVDGNCVASYNAPCGTDNGIKIVCASGKSCIEGRCRSEIRSRAKNIWCNEDIDCQEGLKCVQDYGVFASAFCK